MDRNVRATWAGKEKNMPKSADKFRNTTDVELKHQERELQDQLFRLKFQLSMGQSESLKKIRELRKDIARVKTIARQRELSAVGEKK